MDAKRRAFPILIIALFLLVACATPAATYGPVNVEQAQATYAAAVNVATAQAAQAQHTAVAQQQAEVAGATAVAQATRDMVTLTADASSARATVQALDVEATRSAIASNATATAVGMAAQVEQRLVADEAARLAIQRERERVAVRRDELWSAIWPVLVVVAAFAGLVVALAMAYAIYQRTKPVVIQRGEGREPAVLIYSGNGYRQLSEPRVAASQPLTLPPGETPAQIEMPAITGGHALVVGPTDAGKSTAMRAIIKARLDEGQQVYVLDPHHEPGSWLNAEVIGGGRNFGEIGQFMDWMMEILNQRAQMMAQGDTSFVRQSITVATDEMPAIVDELDRKVAMAWRKWVREGRKFRLFLTVSTQSTRVRTLGIDGEGDVLRNFGAILYLGESAVESYPDLVAEQERPAVLRTLRSAQPVIVPNIQPNEDRRGEPVFIAPTVQPNGADYHRPENVGLSTADGFISPAQIRQIMEMTSRGESGREIERVVFGYHGGAAYKQRLYVCQVLGLAV